MLNLRRRVRPRVTTPRSARFVRTAGGDGNFGHRYRVAGEVTHIYADGQSTSTISVDLLERMEPHADTVTLS